MLGPGGLLQTVVARPLPERMALRARGVLPRRALVAAALLSLLLGAALARDLADERSSVLPAGQVGTSAHTGLSSLPLTLQGPVSQVLGSDGRAYRVGASGGSLQAANPAQRLHLSFNRSGPLVSSGKTVVRLSLAAMGYGSSLRPLGGVTPSVHANRVLYAHAGLSEWYANGPLGLEQSFEVDRAPSAKPAGPLTLTIALSGDAHVSLASGGQSLALTRAGGPALRYGGLYAADARGRGLHSWLELHRGKVLLRVDTRGARYPLRIDPFVQQAKLTAKAPEEIGSGQFGNSVALSSDGNTALIGGFHDNGSVGAAWVFTRSGTTWTQQGEKLTAKSGEEIGSGQFGASVALSSDGNTALIGGPADNSSEGAAWVFTRSGMTWTQQSVPKLTGVRTSIVGIKFGTSVALSSDGNTALIGSPGDNNEMGSASVFTRSEGKWAQQGSKFKGSDESAEPHFGTSVALSSDGNTALIGGPGDNPGQCTQCIGAGWVFTRSASVWTQQGLKLKASDEIGKGQFGESVALSSDGNTALIGGPADNSNETTLPGAAWVFMRSGSMWTQAEKLAVGGQGQFGWSVSLSGEANTALIGDGAGGAGVAWVFTRSGGVWGAGRELTGKEEIGSGEFGKSVALSSDANTPLIGGPADNGKVGAAWAFERKPGYVCNGVPTCKTLISWGTLALRTVMGGSGEVTCHTVGGGFVETPAGGAGIGSTQAFATFDCEQTGFCPAGTAVAVAAEKLPWPSALEAEGIVNRSKITGIKENVGCFSGGAQVAGTTFVGSLRPNFKIGTSALHPGFLEYDAKSGSLEKEGSAGSVLARIEGETKILGYEEQELINVKR